MITPFIPHSYLVSRALTVQAMKAGMSQNVACPMSSAVLVENGRVLCFTTVSIETLREKMRSNYQLLYRFGAYYLALSTSTSGWGFWAINVLSGPKAFNHPILPSPPVSALPTVRVCCSSCSAQLASLSSWELIAQLYVSSSSGAGEN